MAQPRAEDSMKDPSMGTNALLAKILEAEQQQITLLTTLIQEVKEEGNTLKLSLKVQSDSKVLLQQLVNAIDGEAGSHKFTVLVQQLAKEIAGRLKA